MSCNNMLRAERKSYPRTCAECGLGPCNWKPAQAIAAPIDIKQVQTDFDNGTLICRETWRQVLDLAARAEYLEVQLANVNAAHDALILITRSIIKDASTTADGGAP